MLPPSTTARAAFSSGAVCAGVAVPPFADARSVQVAPSAELNTEEPSTQSCEFQTTRALKASQHGGSDSASMGTSLLHSSSGEVFQVVPDSSAFVPHRSK